MVLHKPAMRDKRRLDDLLARREDGMVALTAIEGDPHDPHGPQPYVDKADLRVRRTSKIGAADHSCVGTGAISSLATTGEAQSDNIAAIKARNIASFSPCLIYPIVVCRTSFVTAARSILAEGAGDGAAQSLDAPA